MRGNHGRTADRMVAGQAQIGANDQLLGWPTQGHCYGTGGAFHVHTVRTNVNVG